MPTAPAPACPPYHLAIVIGGLSAELTLKTVKLASCRYLDNLPTTGNENGRAFRDMESRLGVSVPLQLCSGPSGQLVLFFKKGPVGRGGVGRSTRPPPPGF